MAMLAKTTFPMGGAPTMVTTDYSSGLPTSRRIPAVTGNSHGGGYTSPAESDYSDSEGPDSVKNWDEDRVCDYLASVKCGEYEKLFRKNHINGENLLEMDKEVLKEMGIDKVGDRVRLFLSIKKLRTKAYANQKKRHRVRFPSSYSIHLSSNMLWVKSSERKIANVGCPRTLLLPWISFPYRPMVAPPRY